PVDGVVLIAPAVDMTERLMWRRLPDEARKAIAEDGVFWRPSAYGDGPYPITRTLIDDGRRHLLHGAPFDYAGPVHILHGARDSDVPVSESSHLGALLTSADLSVTIIPDGDHRLSRPADIKTLMDAIDAMVTRVDGNHSPAA
ncbi:MAG: alpha/beta hydrolase, partial [Pseudomonadota bacterium]